MFGRGRLIFAPVAAAGIAWFAVWATYPLHWRHWNGTLNVLWTVVAGVAGAATLVATRPQVGSPTRRSFQLLAAASLAWAGGQAVWAYDVIVRGVESPYPSFADVGYLSSYVLFAAALAVWPRTRRMQRGSDIVEVALATAAAALVIFEFGVRPVLGEPFGLGAVLDVVYPVAGLGLAAIALMGLFFDGWAERGPFVVVLCGLFLLGSADTAFAHVDGSYAELLDPLWTLPFIAVAVAACLGPRTSAARIRFPDWTGVAFMLVAFVAVRLPHVVDDLQMSGVAGVIGQVAFSVVLLATVAHAVRMTRQRKREADRLALMAEELERSYSERDAALEASRTGVAFFENRRPRFCNRAFIELLDPTIGGGDWADVLSGVDSASSAGSEWMLDRGDRRLRVFATALAGARVLVTVDDVTQDEREREIRDRFVVEVLRARDREVRQIAELLHDDAVQQLTALALRLELEGMHGGGDKLIGFARQANAITGSIRRLLVDLHPPILESRGLGAAIDATADDLRRSGVDVSVAQLDLRLAPELEQLAFSVAQEVLANVARHAHAARVEVRFAVDGPLFECEIRDDGIGFDVDHDESALSTGRLGLHLARERVEFAGGAFDVQSVTGAGTTVAFSLPIAVRAAEEVAA